MFLVFDQKQKEIKLLDLRRLTWFNSRSRRYFHRNSYATFCLRIRSEPHPRSRSHLRCFSSPPQLPRLLQLPHFSSFPFLASPASSASPLLQLPPFWPPPFWPPPFWLPPFFWVLSSIQSDGLCIAKTFFFGRLVKGMCGRDSRPIIAKGPPI